ncbi:hypothetical protein [Streptomyces sp. NPDC001820]|uniref:hypothetical protein n=1 Tax=Streptomyces sp. NPDC001820 TaxID=3364613 RepID=UPI0036D05F82
MTIPLSPWSAVWKPPTLAFSSLTAAKMGRGQELAAAEGDLLALLLPFPNTRARSGVLVKSILGTFGLSLP